MRSLLSRLGIYGPARDLYQRALRPGEAAHRQRVKAFFGAFVDEGDLVFDVGANDGRYTGIFKDLGARIVAVEPNPVLAKLLRSRYGVDVEQSAMGAAPGEADLYLGTSHILSTLSTEWMDIARREELSNQWSGETVTVPVSTLDALIERFGRPDYVKIDVEGYEPEVLRGLSQTLPLVSFEVQGPAIHLGRECVGLLDDLGRYEYSVSPLDGYRLATGWVPGNQLFAELEGLVGRGHGDVFARVA